ncbi:MAG TPA: hypothetical protein VJ794_00230 [Gemmatimonadales bacterium]|nr:hypothetical protein [Gemmatimonadales bacterium]
MRHPHRRLWLVMAGLAAVAVIGVAALFLFRPKTLLDTGPLNLPGIPDGRRWSRFGVSTDGGQE